jgi:hypothetical protein
VRHRGGGTPGTPGETPRDRVGVVAPWRGYVARMPILMEVRPPIGPTVPAPGPGGPEITQPEPSPTPAPEAPSVPDPEPAVEPQPPAPEVPEPDDDPGRAPEPEPAITPEPEAPPEQPGNPPDDRR